MSKRFPGKRFSIVRLFIAIIIATLLIAVVVGGWWYAKKASRPAPDPWFAGYVDVTATPYYDFEVQHGTASQNVVLSFVVAKDEQCVPSWGNYYTLDDAETSLDLDRRIQQVHDTDRTAMISFGGRDGTDLAAACDTPESLAQAYSDTIERYSVTVLDFDIEGAALTDTESLQRRVDALVLLQQEASEASTDLAIWLTLPADTHGLTDDGLRVVSTMLSAGVRIAGVNLMTMDFSVPSTEKSAEALVEESLDAGHTQLLRYFAQYGDFATSSQVWAMMGATVMIGQSDIDGEVFTTANAQELQEFSASVGLGRVSIWSSNRDYQCADNYTDWTTATTSCSGVEQDTREFATILSASRTGSANQTFGYDITVTPTAHDRATPTSATSDDPATSPYDIWNENTTYTAGTKVVWHRMVYLALWQNQGYQPDTVTRENGIDSTPWRVVGPVLEGETPQPHPTLPEDYYPAWNSTTIYDEGDRVMLDGTAYEAKWWTQGDSPAASASLGDESPWRQLTDAEVEALNQ